MHFRTTVWLAAALIVVGGTVAAAPAAGATTAEAGTISSAPVGTRYLSTPIPDPKPPVDARRYATMNQSAIPVADGLPERIGASNRYATAAQVARQFGSANAVIVANGSSAKGGFDALSANYLAGMLAAPIVLTAGGALEPDTASAVQAILAGSTDPAIYVMGGEDSVSAAAAGTLGAIAATIAGTPGDYVQRVAGDSRYATSALASSAAGAAPKSIGFGTKAPLPTAILASGVANADALAAGPISNAWGAPVLLTAARALPAEIGAAITALGIKQLIVLGGTDRVSDAAVAQAQAAGAVRIQRIAGANRFATAASLYTSARTTLVGPGGLHYSNGQRAFLANGITGFPDALAVGPLAAKLGAPLLTVSADSLDNTTLAYLNSAKAALATVTVLGTAASVGNVPWIVAKAAIGTNILAGSDGVVPTASDTDAKFEAAAAKLTTFDAKLQLARTYLPGKGAAIGALYPYMLAGWSAAGLTQFPTCDVWMDSTLPDDQLLDILRHEYVHALQCRANNKGFDPGYVTTSDTVIGGVERGADAGGYLLGNNYMYYVQYGPTPGPLRPSEIVVAQRLLDFYKIPYHIG